MMESEKKRYSLLFGFFFCLVYFVLLKICKLTLFSDIVSGNLIPDLFLLIICRKLYSENKRDKLSHSVHFFLLVPFILLFLTPENQNVSSLYFLQGISICLLTPCAEELFFRGLLLKLFQFQYSSRAAILLSALCFAFFHVHLGPFFALFTLFLSVLLGLLSVRLKSPFPGLIFHCCWNSFFFLNLYAQNVDALIFFFSLFFVAAGFYFWKIYSEKNSKNH